ncbi:MAG: hypothetical protein FWH43_00515 [Endomicrobia bacterium]|nr:hypothetical protein [Endomicrobiia bacterium]
MTETIKVKIISMLILTSLMFNLFSSGTMLNSVIGLDTPFKAAVTAGFYTYNPLNFCESISNKIVADKKETAKQEKQNRQEPSNNKSNFAIINANSSSYQKNLTRNSSLPTVLIGSPSFSSYVPLGIAKSMNNSVSTLIVFFLLTYLAILFRKEWLMFATDRLNHYPYTYIKNLKTQFGNIFTVSKLRFFLFPLVVS